MGTVLRAVGQRDGTTWVQVVARLPGRRDLRWLRASATQVEVPPRWQSPALGVALRGLQRLVRALSALLEFFLTSSSQPAPRAGAPGRPAPTPWQRERMTEAGDKLAAGPHLLVSVRVLAVRGSRREAADTARLAAAGFAITSRRLRMQPLWLPGWLVGNRWAWPAHWLLLSATELAVLVHLPADPARYGFDTAAAHRAPPPHAARPGTGAPPNPPPARQPGWSALDRQHPQPEPAPAARPDARSWPDDPDDEEEGDDDEYPPR